MTAPRPTPLRTEAAAERMPPYNTECEQATLGAILLDNKSYRKVAAYLRPEHFGTAVHARIFSAIGTQIERGEIATPVTLKNLFDQDGALVDIGGAQYLARLVTEVPGPADDYAGIVHDCYMRRELMHRGEQLAEDAAKFDLSRPAEQIYEEHAAWVAKITKRRPIDPDDDVWEMDDEPIQPRGWLLGNTFCREFLSVLIADGGVGKTALRIAQYLSCATGRKLTDQHVFVRCRVLVIFLEDGKKELKRRLRAAMLHYGITAADTKGWLFLWTPKGIRLMETDPRGKPMLGEMERQLRHQVKARNIDIIGIDPFIKSHGLDENDNNAMDKVASLLAGLAQEFDLAADIVHHTRKGPSDPGNADLGRGAIATKDAGRIVDTLTPMSKEEAEAFNINEQDRKLLVRLDNGKANLMPKAADARWFKLVGVKLSNPSDLYPHGDEVQTVECWAPPDTFAQLTLATINAILDRIDKGPYEGGRYSSAPNAKDRAVWPLVKEFCPTLNDKQAKDVIATWLKNGVLVKRDHEDPKDRHSHPSLFVGKHPGDAWAA